MSNIYKDMKSNKTNYYEDYNIKKNTKQLPKIALLNNNASQFEDEIIDELINRKITNNICCLKLENTNRNVLSKSKSYKIKSKRICLSVDSKKEKRMKLKDWLTINIENTKRIEEDIEDLIIEIFVNRYNSYPEKDCLLSENALESKKQIEQFCPKLYEFSIYLLYVIYQKFNTFFEYLGKQIDFKSIPLSEINKIKEILFLTGVDIKKVFEKAFEKTNNFNLSNILMIMFDEYLVKENKIKICKEIKNSPFYKEKEKFEKYLRIVSKNIYFFETESEIDKDEESHKNNNILNDNINIVNDKEKQNNNNYKNSEDENENENENENETKIKIKIKEDNDINSQSDKENKQKNHINNNITKENHKNKNTEKNNIEKNNLIQNLNIDDLVNYINDSDKDKTKKRKKKKKGKKNKLEQMVKEENESEYIEKDLVFLNYKKALEEYTKNVKKTEKVKPIYSEEFLKKIQILTQ